MAASVSIEDANKAWGEASKVIAKSIQSTLKGVEKEMATRAVRASNAVRNSSVKVLRGQRSGRKYRIPYSRVEYRASTEGEAPAVRTGNFRLSWGMHVHVEKKGSHFRVVSGIESRLRVGNRLLGDILEDGTRRMRPRSYKQKVIDGAMAEVTAIYSKPYSV